jgi:hypothetical protein
VRHLYQRSVATMEDERKRTYEPSEGVNNDEKRLRPGDATSKNHAWSVLNFSLNYRGKNSNFFNEVFIFAVPLQRTYWELKMIESQPLDFG